MADNEVLAHRLLVMILTLKLCLWEEYYELHQSMSKFGTEGRLSLHGMIFLELRLVLR